MISKHIVEKSRAAYTTKKAEHRELVRRRLLNETMKRDSNLHSVLTKDPQKLRTFPRLLIVSATTTSTRPSTS